MSKKVASTRWLWVWLPAMGLVLWFFGFIVNAKGQDSPGDWRVDVLPNSMAGARPSASAREWPLVEVGAGYAHNRARLPATGRLNGWTADLFLNPTRWLGLGGEFTGTYGNLVGAKSNRVHTWLFGPRFSLARGRVRPYGQVLFGVARATEANQLTDIFDFSRNRQARLTVPPDVTIGQTETVFALAAGAGLDWKLNRHLALRLAQADYLRTQFAGSRQHTYRYSAGLVFRLY
jgi:hypothetical protein